MHGNKTKPGVPCRNGHPYRRNSRGQCIDCRLAHASRNKKGKRPPAYLVADGREWIWHARKSLRKRSAGPRPLLHELIALWDRQRRVCALTHLPIVGTPQLDHKTPVSRGGRNNIDNLQWVSRMANFAKNNSTDVEFRAWLLAAADALRQKMKLEELL